MLTAFIFMTSYAYSQKTYSITKSKIFDKDILRAQTDYLYRNDEIILFKSRGQEIEISKFDKNSAKLISKKTENKLKEGEEVLGTISMKNSDYLLTSTFSSKEENRIYAYKMDYGAGKLGDKTLLRKEKEDLYGYFDKTKKIRAIHEYHLSRAHYSAGLNRAIASQDVIVLTSLDSSRIAMAYVPDAGKRSENKSNATFTWVQYDEQLNKLWETDINFPFATNLLTSIKFHLANNGDIYILAVVMSEKLPIFGPRKTTIELSKIDGKTQEFSHKMIDAPFDLNRSLTLTENKNNQIFVLGTYDDSMDINYRRLRLERISAEGFFLTQINDDLNTGEFITYRFPDETKAKYFKARTIKSLKRRGKINKLKMVNLFITDVDFNDDNSFTIFSEALWLAKESMPSHTDSGSSISFEGQSNHKFATGNIITMHVNSHGEATWSDKFHKYQMHPEINQVIGYFYTSTEDYSYLVYGDHQGNLESDPGKRIKERRCYTSGHEYVSDLVVRKIDKKTGKNVGEYTVEFTEVAGFAKARVFGMWRLYSLGNGDFILLGAPDMYEEQLYIFKAK